MRRLLAMLALPLLLIAACSDAGSALSRAESTGVLNVGVVEGAPGVEVRDGGEVTGAPADAITAYADSIGAHPSWQVGEVSALADAVGRSEIDVVIGADPGVERLVTTDPGAKGATFSVGDAETPLKDSINAWAAQAD